MYSQCGENNKRYYFFSISIKNYSKNKKIQLKNIRKINFVFKLHEAFYKHLEIFNWRFL